jgi:hypothetical protein
MPPRGSFPPIPLTCPAGHTFTSTGKPGATADCPTCLKRARGGIGKRGRVRIPADRPRTIREVPAWLKSHGTPDDSPPEFSDDPDEPHWSAEQSYDQESPNLHHRPGAGCAQCGAESVGLTPRGTFVLCGSCGEPRHDIATADRINRAIGRINSRNARSLVARESAKPLDTDTELMIAERCGRLALRITDLISALNPADALNPNTRDHSAGLIGRLVRIRETLNGITRSPKHDSLELLDKLEGHIEREAQTAGPVITELMRARATREEWEEFESSAPLASEPPRKSITDRMREPMPDHEPVIRNTGRTCDMHRNSVMATGYATLGHRDIVQYQQADTTRVDLCEGCFKEFERNPDRLLQATGYEYCYAGRY